MSDISESQQAVCGPPLNSPLCVGMFALLFNETFLLGGIKYGEVSGFMVRRQAEQMLRKYPNATDLGLEAKDTRAAAARAFLQAEEQCKVVNRTLASRTAALESIQDPIIAVLRIASAKFQDVLEASFDPSGLAFGFGPGSTSSLRYTEANALAKCNLLKWEVTPAFSEHASVVMDAIPSLTISELRHVNGGVLCFVPKNSDTDRTILIEPDLNILAQQGLGKALRAGFAKVSGIDLDNQADKAREMIACDRSLRLATEDLSMASDTIAIATVRLISTYARPLSRRGLAFMAALETARSPAYRATRKSKTGTTFEKWSSMGNSYTFELESTIFWSLAYAATLVCNENPEGSVSIFGDDIIVPCTVIPLLRRVLAHLGFRSNEEKSFCEGPFRETCGREVYNTRDVSPFRIKARIVSHGQVYWLANTFRKWYNRLYEVATEEGVDLPLPFELWGWVWKHIPAKNILKGPESLNGIDPCGDGHLHVEAEYYKPYMRRCLHGHEGHMFFTWVTEPASVTFDEVPLAYALKQAEELCADSAGRRISRALDPIPPEGSLFSGEVYSTACFTRGTGERRKALVKVFAKPLPRGRF